MDDHPAFFGGETGDFGVARGFNGGFLHGDLRIVRGDGGALGTVARHAFGFRLMKFAGARRGFEGSGFRALSGGFIDRIKRSQFTR